MKNLILSLSLACSLLFVLPASGQTQTEAGTQVMTAEDRDTLVMLTLMEWFHETEIQVIDAEASSQQIQDELTDLDAILRGDSSVYGDFETIACSKIQCTGRFL